MTEDMITGGPVPSNNNSVRQESPKSVDLLTVPLELRHLIFKQLDDPPDFIVLLQPESYHVIDDLGSIVLTCQQLRAEVIDWYTGIKSHFNLVTVPLHGQVNFDATAILSVRGMMGNHT